MLSIRTVPSCKCSLLTRPKPQVEVIELEPEWRSYDALLSPELEVVYAS